MKLSEYLASPDQIHLKETSETGEPSPWLEFTDLELKGSQFQVADAQLIPSKKDGLFVELIPGKYAVQAVVTNFGGDLRISRLRVQPPGSDVSPGAQIGKTGTDTATIGICDFETFVKVWGKDKNAARQIIERCLAEDSKFGLAELDVRGGAVMPFVHSGFGDGSFPVFELMENGRRIGFEIEFIPRDKKYPFAATPYQKASRLGKIKERADQGDITAQFEMGGQYAAGKEVEKNLETAAGWYEKAAQNGHAEAAFRLGLFYVHGKAGKQDFVQARELFEYAASKDVISAWNELGILYRYGRGVPVDHKKAVGYYQQAADKSFASAQFNLAVHYSKGWGVPQSHEESMRLYRLAADQGNLNAIFNLGNILKQGETGVSKDEKEAFRLFSAGAMNNHPGCANNLADCYETGTGTEKDLKKAFFWYAIAAGKEIPVAQKSLGILYKNGEGGIKRNPALAVKYISMASKNGLAEAHNELGWFYETGEVVARDLVKACQLYQKAVKGGFAGAEEKLKELSASLSESERIEMEKDPEK